MRNIAEIFLQKHPAYDFEHIPTPKLERFCAQELKKEGYPSNGSIVRKVVESVKAYRRGQ